MRNRNRRWLVAWILILPCLVRRADGSKKETELSELREENDNASTSKEARGIFAPRMDYEQWTPLGMGDPLKNDPTYDYVPPVLDRVRYWIDPENRKPDLPISEEPKKTEILLLGVTSKKPSTGTSALADTQSDFTRQLGYDNLQIADSRKDTFDPFLKMVEGPKFSIPNSFQKISKPHYSLPSFYPPKPFHPNKYNSEQRMPYTMLVPPPIQTQEAPENSDTYLNENNPIQSTAHPMIRNVSQSPQKSPSSSSTKSVVTVEHADIIYQSSSYGDPNEFKFINHQNNFGSFPEASNQIVFKAQKPDSIKETEMDNSSSMSEFAEKTRNNSGKILTGFGQNLLKSPTEDSSKYPEVMIKGQVTDADLGIANTYVNIGKAEAQMHPPSGISGISVDPPKIPVMQPPIIMNINRPHHNTMITSPQMHAPLRKPGNMRMKERPVTLQILQTMQTMQPPPPSPSLTKPESHVPPISMPSMSNTGVQPINPLQGILKGKPEVSVPETVTKKFSNEEHFLPTTTHTLPSTTTPTPTTTDETVFLTTDPLFKHYKQPTEPLRGPLYLIIQGHSKVKTYGPSKQVHGISIQENNEIINSDEKDPYSVKHLHGGKKKEKSEERPRESRSNKLQTLSHVVQTGLGSINLPDIQINRRSDNIQETELSVRYDVSSQAGSTSERYHKGIVEAGDVSRKLKGDDAQ